MPSKSNIIRRLIKTVNFSENGVETIDLFRQYDLSNVLIHLTGTFDLNVAAATSVRDTAPAGLIKRIELFADGTKNHAEEDGRLTAFGNFERGMIRTLTQPTVGTGVGKVVDAWYQLPRNNLDGPRPKDSALHTTRPFMGLLQLRTTFGAFSNIYTPAGATTFTNIAVQAKAYQDEIQEFNASDALEGKFIRRTSLQELTIDASNSNLEIKIPTGALLRGVKVMALDENGDAVDTVVNNVKINSGVNVRIDLPWAALRAQNKTDYRIENGLHDPGFAFADLSPDGKLNKLFDLTNASEANLVLDVSKPAGGNGKVIAHILEFIEQAGAQA